MTMKQKKKNLSKISHFQVTELNLLVCLRELDHLFQLKEH